MRTPLRAGVSKIFERSRMVHARRPAFLRLAGFFARLLGPHSG